MLENQTDRQSGTFILARLSAFHNQAKADGGRTYAEAAARIQAKAEADPTRLNGTPAILHRPIGTDDSTDE